MRTLLCTLAAGLALAAVPAVAAETLFEFERFAGIPTPGLVVRDVAGGGLPWSIERGEARLLDDGTLKVEVGGLVLAAGPNTGRNPIPFFMATLSCLDAGGGVVNVSSTPVPATEAGDAKLEEVLPVPGACLAPVVLVGSASSGTFPHGRWFAVSGY